MAMLLAHAMRRPLAGRAHRPRRIHVRGHPQWKELFPHLDKLDIKVAVHRELPKGQEAYRGYLRKKREVHRRGMVKPTADQQTVEKLFSAIAQWVRGYGHIESGDQEMFGFVARALCYGNLAFEDDTVARTIRPHRYTPSHIVTELKQLLDNPVYSQRACEVGEQLHREDGVRAACDALEGGTRTPILRAVRCKESG